MESPRLRFDLSSRPPREQPEPEVQDLEEDTPTPSGPPPAMTNESLRLGAAMRERGEAITHQAELVDNAELRRELREEVRGEKSEPRRSREKRGKREKTIVSEIREDYEDGDSLLPALRRDKAPKAERKAPAGGAARRARDDDKDVQDYKRQVRQLFLQFNDVLGWRTIPAAVGAEGWKELRDEALIEIQQASAASNLRAVLKYCASMDETIVAPLLDQGRPMRGFAKSIDDEELYQQYLDQHVRLCAILWGKYLTTNPAMGLAQGYMTMRMMHIAAHSQARYVPTPGATTETPPVATVITADAPVTPEAAASMEDL